MEKLHNLKERICSYDNLYEAFVSAAKGKADRSEVLVFAFNLEENLYALRQELLNRTYKVGPYREFYVRYPKPRLVMALGFRDRVVQWAIYRQIDPFMDRRFIEHSYGCRKDKGTLAAARCLMGWLRVVSRKPDARDYYIIKGDVSKYFYRVDHEIVMKCYAEICDEEWFTWIMDVIINNPEVPFGLPEGMGIDDCPRDKRLFEVGQPIGNLTSQETANIYLDRLDQYCKHVLKLHYYVRYMDDFCAIVKGKDEAKRVFSLMSDFLTRELRLDMSKKGADHSGGSADGVCRLRGIAPRPAPAQKDRKAHEAQYEAHRRNVCRRYHIIRHGYGVHHMLSRYDHALQRLFPAQMDRGQYRASAARCLIP